MRNPETPGEVLATLAQFRSQFEQDAFWRLLPIVRTRPLTAAEFGLVRVAGTVPRHVYDNLRREVDQTSIEYHRLQMLREIRT